jgi:peptide-methionine (S)-S-oxide reductase
MTVTPCGRRSSISRRAAGRFGHFDGPITRMPGAGTAAAVVIACLTALAMPPRADAQEAQPAPSMAAQPAAAPLQTAVFAGGCFWCVESDFDKVEGVVSTISGYLGGSAATATYPQVSSGATGHTEAVQVVFDPGKVSYQQLVDYFWRTIDPTVKDRQFCDLGAQYRSGIYPLSDDQMRIAQESRAALERGKPFRNPIVTEIVAAGPFYVAEEYHQDYYRKNPLRYKFYRTRCGRDQRIVELWGKPPSPEAIAQ